MGLTYKKRMERYNVMVKNGTLDVFGFEHPLGKERTYPCPTCGRDTNKDVNGNERIRHWRLIYCLMCARGYLHPRYNFDLDKLENI